MLGSPGAVTRGCGVWLLPGTGPEPSFSDQVREGSGAGGLPGGVYKDTGPGCVCVFMCVCLCRESGLSTPHPPPLLEAHRSMQSGDAPSALAGDVGHKWGQGCGTCPSWADLLCAHGARDLPAPDLDA